MKRRVWLPLAAAAMAVSVIAIAGVSAAHEDRGGAQASDRVGQCVSAPLDDSRIVDDKTLLITDSHGDAALLKMTTACLTDRFDPVGVEMRGTDQICGPLDADITGGLGHGVPEACIVQSFTPISASQALAYENRKSN